MSRLVALCLLHQAAAQALEQVGAVIDGDLDSQFGSSVALSGHGKHLAVGAMTLGPSGHDRGALRVFENVDGAWSQVGADMEGNANEMFGAAVAMNSNGTRVVIGSSNTMGVARVYQYGSGQWSQVGATMYGEGRPSFFGLSVAMSADGAIIAIANHYHDSNAGRVQVFEESGGQWVLKGGNMDGAPTSQFGASLSLSADGLIVAVGSSHSYNYFGSLLVYAFGDGGWEQMGGEIVGPSSWGGFGRAVSLSGSGLRVACGADSVDTPESNVGAVMVFEFRSNDWTQLGATIMGDAYGSRLGGSVSLSHDGSRLACGGPYAAGERGYARVYEYNSTAWAQIGEDVEGSGATLEQNGKSVALSADGSHFAIGAPKVAGNGYRDGNVRVFKLPPVEPIFLDAAVSSIRIDAVHLFAACVVVFMM